MSRDVTLYLEDIRDSATKALKYCAGITFDVFCADSKTFDAVARNLEIIGEAVKHIPVAIREDYPEIPWSKIAGLRDVIAHGYFGLDEELLWNIVSEELPKLLAQIEALLRE